MHVHVQCPRSEAKFWIEPAIVLARSAGLAKRELRVIRGIIEEHRDEIIGAWHRHFSR